MDSWPDIIEAHVRSFESGERRVFDKINDFFLGNAWTATTVGDSEAELIKTSTNLVFPVVETATSVLVPSNPQVTGKPRRKDLDRERVQATEDMANWCLDVGGWRRELTVCVQNTVMFGRGPVKTTWDSARDMPVTRWVDPRAFFFDRTALRFEDIRYEIEATVLSRRDIERRVREGLYDRRALELSGGVYPEWLARTRFSGDDERLRKIQPWFLVYEVYCRESGKVYHYAKGDDKPLLEDELTYRPYDMLTFMHNGKDAGGVSEIGLILSNQEEMNWTETFLLNILRFSVPAIYYDGAASGQELQSRLAMAPLGSRVPVMVPSGKRLSEMFMPSPMPQVPAVSGDILARKREAIALVSSLSDAQRAQVVGAKTATEMMFIEQGVKNRLRPRMERIADLTAAVAEKQVFLAARYMRNAKAVQITGTEEWREVARASLYDTQVAFKLVPYNAVESNKAVRVEVLRNIQPLLVGNPHIDQRKLTAKLLEDADLGDILLPIEQVQAVAARMQLPPEPAPVAPAEPAPIAPAEPAPAPAPAPE